MTYTTDSIPDLTGMTGGGGGRANGRLGLPSALAATSNVKSNRPAKCITDLPRASFAAPPAGGAAPES